MNRIELALERDYFDRECLLDLRFLLREELGIDEWHQQVDTDLLLWLVSGGKHCSLRTVFSFVNLEPELVHYDSYTLLKVLLGSIEDRAFMQNIRGMATDDLHQLVLQYWEFLDTRELLIAPLGRVEKSLNVNISPSQHTYKNQQVMVF